VQNNSVKWPSSALFRESEPVDLLTIRDSPWLNVCYIYCFLAVSGNPFCGRDNRRESLLHVQTQFLSYSRGKLRRTTARAVGGRRYSGHKRWIPATDLRYRLLLRLLHVQIYTELLQKMSPLVWWQNLSLLQVSLYLKPFCRSRLQCQWSSAAKQASDQCRAEMSHVTLILKLLVYAFETY